MGIPPPPPSRVYWLAPPSQLKEQEDLLRRLMFQVVGVTDASRYKFWVSESSGWWTFADTQALWRKGGRTSPVATQAIAKQKAEAFIAAWTKALTDHAAKPSSPVRSSASLSRR